MLVLLVVSHHKDVLAVIIMGHRSIVYYFQKLSDENALRLVVIDIDHLVIHIGSSIFNLRTVSAFLNRIPSVVTFGL